jgi:hypothetical protein
MTTTRTPLGVIVVESSLPSELQVYTLADVVSYTGTLLTSLATPLFVRRLIRSADGVERFQVTGATLAFNEVDAVESDSLQTITFPQISTLMAAPIDIQRCPRLTSVSFPKIESVTSGYWSIINNKQLTTISAPLLVTFTSSSLIISSNLVLATVTFPLLQGGANSGVTLSTDPALTSCSFPALTVVDAVTLTTLPLLTSVTFSALRSLKTLTLTSLTTITTMSFPALRTMGNLALTGCTLLSTLSFANLMYIVGTQASNSIGLVISTCPALATLSVPLLTTACLISLTGPDVQTAISFPALTAITADTLTTVPATTTGGSLTIATHASLTSLSLPVCTSVAGANGIVVSGCTALTDIDLSSLQVCGGPITCSSSNGNITTVAFPPVGTLRSVGGNVTFATQKLTQASVDAILVSLASLDGTGGTTAYSSKTVTLSGGTNATPSATGLTAKTTLVARGCTVTNN